MLKEQKLDQQLKEDNIEYEKKIFAKHLCIPGSPEAIAKAEALKVQHQKLIKEKVERVLANQMNQKKLDSDFTEGMIKLDKAELASEHIRK